MAQSFTSVRQSRKRNSHAIEPVTTTWTDVTNKPHSWGRYLLNAPWTPERVFEVRNLHLTYGGETETESLLLAVKLKNKIKDLSSGRLLTVLSEDTTSMWVFFEFEKDALLTKLFYQKMSGSAF